MKKILLLMTAMMLFSSLCYADHDDYRERGNGWGHREHEHHHRDYYQQPEGRYYQQQYPAQYYQQPAVIYQQQPPIRYYQQPPVIYQQQPVYSQPVQYPSNGLRLHW
jgi:hypothetical protein